MAKILDVHVKKGMITEWQSYTPTFTGFGVPTSVDFRWRQNGTNIEIEGNFIPGTGTAVEGRISLPNSFTILSTAPSIFIRGQVEINGSGAAGQTVGSSYGVYGQRGVGYMVFGGRSSGTTGLASILGAAFGSSNTSLYASFPVSGLVANA